MTRLLVILVLAVLVILAALTAFGSAGGWVAAVVLAVVAAMWFVRHGPPAVQVILVVVALLAAAYIPAARVVHYAAQRASCVSRLKSLVLALHSYHQAFDAFPPAFIADDQGRPMHSWRVLILPHIAEGSLYDRYDFDEPWDGPNNRLLIERGSAAFRCSSDARPREAGITNYVAVVGPDTAWPGTQERTLKEFPERSTIVLVETFASDICWLEPRDLSVEEFVAELTPEPTFLQWWLQAPPPGWRYHRYPPDRNIAFENGRCVSIRGDLTPEAARALARMDVDSEPFLDALDGRERLPAVLAALPVTEGAIRRGGFFTLLAAAVALLIAVRGVRRPRTGERGP